MELHNLKPAKGSTRKSKRLGRGQGSGYGGTSTKGNKGAQSRSGYSTKIGHEGGQQPLQRRVPKFGFKNPFRVEYKPINVGLLEQIASEKKIKVFDQKVLIELGLVNKNDLIKILADGEIKQSLEITAHRYSKKAEEAIEKAGGKASKIVKPEGKTVKSEKTGKFLKAGTKPQQKAKKGETKIEKEELKVEKTEKPIEKAEKEVKPIEKKEVEPKAQEKAEAKGKNQEEKKSEGDSNNTEETK